MEIKAEETFRAACLGFSCSSPGLKCSEVAVKSRKNIENKGKPNPAFKCRMTPGVGFGPAKKAIEIYARLADIVI